MSYNITDIEFSTVCKVLASRMGLHFSFERRDILSRSLGLAAREFGFHNTSEFIMWLSSNILNNEQIEILATYLTIPETYFWREPHVFTALTDFIIPEIVNSEKNRKKSIRIWSAGCSTGEEPYSLAIALHRTIKNIEDWDITIMATDINPKVIDKAKSGIYGTWSFRNTPEWLKSRYFHRLNGNNYEIIPEIKKLVTFSSLSLTQMPSFSQDKKLDIIFCRNVLMYFTNEWVRKISDNLYYNLSENGWFVVASCELSSNMFPKFKTVNFPGAVLYKKGNEEFVTLLNSSEILSTTTTNVNVKPTSLNGSAYNETEITSQKVPELQQCSNNDNQIAINNIALSVNEKSIRELANEGHLEDALLLCNKIISSDRLVPGLYLLRASILQELNMNKEAIESLRQAIYIDPDYIMGYFTLGNLSVLKGNIRKAKKYFKNVLDLTDRYRNDDIIPESEGLSVKYIKEIIFSNMQTYLI